MSEPNPPIDGSLLRAFRTTNDQAAFAELLRRHGRTVIGAARAVVGQSSAAEDVAQATFLSLARKASRLEDAPSLAGWLHHVAVCLARNERRHELRRAAREKEAVMSAAQYEKPPAPSAAVLTVLHEELGSLAERDRAPLVLHHLEGRSYAEAAATLGCDPGTFGARLTRAREKLRKRLVARGVTLGADGIGGVLEEGATSVALPAAFVAATCQAASLLAAGKTLTGSGLVSAKVAYLTKSALKTLFWAKVKTAAAAVVLTAGVAVAGGLVARQALAHRGSPVTAGEPAAPGSAAGLKPLSPWEAWTKELLARAAAGPGEALDFGTCSTRDENGQWFVNNRGGADRRIWVTGLRGHSRVEFETPRCRRGVLVGQMQLVTADPPPAGAARVPVREQQKTAPRFPGVPADSASGYGVFLHGDAKDQLPLLGSDLVTVAVGSGGRDAERFVVYFETNANGQVTVLYAVQPVGREPLPAFGGLSKSLPGASRAGAGIGLFAGSTPVVWQGLKLVPLGPDLPAPPFGTPRRKPQTNDQGDRP